MNITSEFLSRRKAEIEDQITELQAELRQIAAAQAVVQVNETRSAPCRRDRRPETIRQQVIKILEASGKPMKASEIQEQLSNKFDRNIKRESLSPQLSRLCADAAIERANGGYWELATVKPALERFRNSFEQRNSST